MGRCRQFGLMTDGRPVMSFYLENTSGVSVEVLSLGGIIRSIVMPGRDGRTADIVMGHETLAEQLSDWYWTGGIMGRCVNRIADARMMIGGREYELEKNTGTDNIHGGSGCYMMKLFSAEIIKDREGEKLVLYHKDRGEGGFPGEVDVWVTYVLTSKNELKIRYQALPSEETVLNLTNHCYFNLAGHDSGSIADHWMQVNADFYLPGDERNIPTGEIRSVSGTVFDLRQPRRLGEGLASGNPQILLRQGYDHNFCINGRGFRQAARVFEETSGRCLTVYTDMPGMQLYTSNNGRTGVACKGGAMYKPHDAFCLETQYYPNAVVYGHFISPIAPTGVAWSSETVYRFTTE